MEIYKDTKSEASKEFEKLLNSQISKSKIEEGKIIDGKITKITDKYVYIFIENLKSEPILDVSEIKSLKLGERFMSAHQKSLKKEHGVFKSPRR